MISPVTITTDDVLWAKELLFGEVTKQWVESNGDKEYVYKDYFPNGGKVVVPLLEKLSTIKFLGLDSSEKKKILDIGTGVGHFVHICNALGHDACGTEINSSIDQLKEIHKHYDVDVFPLEVVKQKQFDLHSTYDIITTHRVVFDGNGRFNDVEPWSVNDWLSFRDNVFEFLNPNGVLFIKTNIKSDSHSETIVKAFGEPLYGWNTLTFRLVNNAGLV